MSDPLDNLEAKLNAFKAEEEQEKAEQARGDAESSAMRDGIRAGAELVVSIGSGTAIGYGLDYWLGTSPIFLIIFLLAGVGAGFWNTYRITQGMGTSVGFSALHKEKKDGKTSSENNPDAL